jgi:hypothetical protein
MSVPVPNGRLSMIGRPFMVIPASTTWSRMMVTGGHQHGRRYGGGRDLYPFCYRIV